MQYDPIGVIRRSRQPIRTAAFLGIVSILNLLKRPLVLALLIGIFFLVLIFGEFGLITLIGSCIYFVLRNKRQRDRFELQMRSVGISPDEMRYWEKRAADPDDPIRKDLEFIEAVGRQQWSDEQVETAQEPNAASLDEIIRSTNRLPFSPTEHRYILRFLETEARNGLVVRFHPTMDKHEVLAALNQGALLLHCPQIESDILFVKASEGRGIFGGEKARFIHYISEPMRNAFTAGQSHKHLMVGLTGINNIFRHHGFLSGMAV